MSIFFGLSISFCLLIAYWKRKHNKYSELVFQYKIFTLRDKLRMLAVDDKIDQNGWIFNFYDKTFSICIKDSSSLTIFRLLLLNIIHSNDNDLEVIRKKVDTESSQNQYIQPLRIEFYEVMEDYLLSQHKVSYTCFKPILDSIGLFGTISSKIKDSIKTTLTNPETSAVKSIFNNSQSFSI